MPAAAKPPGWLPRAEKCWCKDTGRHRAKTQLRTTPSVRGPDNRSRPARDGRSPDRAPFRRRGNNPRWALRKATAAVLDGDFPESFLVVPNFIGSLSAAGRRGLLIPLLQPR